MISFRSASMRGAVFSLVLVISTHISHAHPSSSKDLGLESGQHKPDMGKANPIQEESWLQMTLDNSMKKDEMLPSSKMVPHPGVGEDYSLVDDFMLIILGAQAIDIKKTLDAIEIKITPAQREHVIARGETKKDSPNFPDDPCEDKKCVLQVLKETLTVVTAIDPQAPTMEMIENCALTNARLEELDGTIGDDQTFLALIKDDAEIIEALEEAQLAVTQIVAELIQELAIVPEAADPLNSPFFVALLTLVSIIVVLIIVGIVVVYLLMKPKKPKMPKMPKDRHQSAPYYQPEYQRADSRYPPSVQSGPQGPAPQFQHEIPHARRSQY
eukprot:maker-scaffold1372_size44893-snap-gene-0.6 protein:Tk02467 transcript:maker-scaffold1372_size44893-snap-gene-0.6-mRNA-1 annotation:"family transcriptional regulator"